MKVRFLIVAIGLTASLALKWGVGSQRSEDDGSAHVTNSPSTAYIAPGQAADPHADPLIPPIRIPGLLPPLAASQAALVRPISISNVIDVFSHDPQAAFHPHGEQVCASGCAASNHPTEKLTEARFRQLIAEYAVRPIGPENMALETLLYYGRQTRDQLAAMDQLPLDAERAAVLASELAVTNARIAIRVIDEQGEVRSSLQPTSVPFDRRHVFQMETNNLQPLVTSGTVKRVGLYHLWTRL